MLLAIVVRLAVVLVIGLVRGIVRTSKSSQTVEAQG